MSASSVYNALNRAIQTGSIDLWTAATTSPDLSGLIPVLNLLNINATWTLNHVDLALSPDQQNVLMSASGPFNNTLNFDSNATLQYLQQSDTFILTLSVNRDWNFSEFFPFLPDTFMQNPAVDIGIFWNPSIFYSLTVRAAMFTARTGADSNTMTGFLLEPDSQLLLQKIPMVGPWPLRLSGTIRFPNESRNYPIIDLEAKGNNTVINAERQPGIDGPAPVSLLNPGLRLLIQPLIPPQNERVAFSTIRLFADFNLGKIRGQISTLILSVDDVWRFNVVFDKASASLIQGLAELIGIFGVELPLPMNFPVLSDFYVAGIDIDLLNKAQPGSFPSFRLLNLGITIKSDKIWEPPLPYVKFRNVGVRWVWGSTIINGANGESENTYFLSGSIFGTVDFGGSTTTLALPAPAPDITPVSSTEFVNPVSIRTILSIPDFILSGRMEDDSYIPIGQALSWYFGNSGPSTGLQSMNIIGLEFTADPFGGNYFANASILFGTPDNIAEEQGWAIDLGLLTIILRQLDFDIAYINGSISGGMSATFYLDVEDPTDYTLPRLMVEARYPPQYPENPQGWTISGYLYPGTSINLTKLVYQFIYGKQSNPPTWIPDVSVDRLNVVFTTGSTVNGVQTKASYLFGGSVSARWAPEIFGTTLRINASASLDLQKPSTSDTASGTFTGSFSVNKITITASLTFGVPEPTYLFKVSFDQLWLEATTSWRGASDKRHQVISLQLGGITLGDILEYLVNLAAPTLGFRLDPPWDVLKKVDLSRFVLTIDPQDNIVEFVFRADLDLVVAHLDTIGVRYNRDAGEGKVNLILTGDFLGQAYTDDKPLTWDVINDAPPAVPGQGTSLINLRYMGLGQRVTFNGEIPSSVAESIKLLRDEMKPPPDQGDPLPAGMRFSAGSQWLIGLDVSLMETIDIGLIFNDPVLYGLSIGLNGEKAGSLSGLRFEILYKKITEDIGMFRISFQVPDAFRTIQLGAVSITLGIIVVEIYTNGNFKLDLGFPYNRNFERSFSLQAGIFIGRGGFYLGVLNGDTSTKVPKISNGNFSPVIELGIGIAAGVGREIRAGILSGGAYVQLEVIFEGVLAWFNPNSSGVAPARFFRCQGIAALHGKVYGSVDFGVIKVSVTLEAYAQVSILYESYQPMQIAFVVDVRAEASVTIIFVSVSFSFHVRLEMDFKIGSAQPTPWILSGNSSSQKSAPNYRLRTHLQRRMETLQQSHFAMLTNKSAYPLNWQPAAKVFSDSPRNAHLTLLPSFTITDIPVNWDGTIPENNNPVYRTAFLLLADNGMPVDAQSATTSTTRSATHSAMASSNTGTGALAADILTQGLLTYAFNALPRDPLQGNFITAAQLSQLLQLLDDPETMATGLSIASLSTFFQTNIHLWISGDTQPVPASKSGMALPLPPFLNWHSAQGGNIDFSSFNKIGPLYEWGISQWLNNYFPVNSPTGTQPANDDPALYESFTSFLFRDFCRMLIKNGITTAQKMLSNTVVVVQTMQSLEDIAATLPVTEVSYTLTTGDTVENIAWELGATPEELLFLNPELVSQLQLAVGTLISVRLGISPEVLALDNPDIPFAITQCDLGTLVHPAAQHETLQQIAALFQLDNVATLLASNDPTAPNILQRGATFNLESQVFSGAPADFVRLRTAGAFFVRYTDLSLTDDTPIPDMAVWYVQAISYMNQDLLKNLFPEQAIPTITELPPGQVLSVPNLFNTAYTTPGNSNPYTTIPGDTLYRIGYTLVFGQDLGTSSEMIPQWQNFQAGVVAAGNQSWTIPAWKGIKVESGSTIASLVRRLILNVSWTNPDPQDPANGSWSYNWTNIATWLGSADILMPLAAIMVPDARTAVEPILSFRVISTNYGLEIIDVATRLKTVQGLFAAATALQVKWLPSQDIDVLIAGLLEGDNFVSIVNQSTRLLLSGLRLPVLGNENGHVIANTDEFSPLYDLTGQQFNIHPNSSEPEETALSLSISTTAGWISLFNSITVQTGQTLAELEAEYPDLLIYNPGLPASPLLPGMILLTAITTSLDYNYTNADVMALMPADGLAILPVPSSPSSPSPLPVKGTIPRTYGLAHHIELQTPLPLPIPVAANQQTRNGNPGLWMLPAELQTKAREGTTTLYEILSAAAGGEAGEQALQIDNSTFGLLIPLQMKKSDDRYTFFNLIGVDTDNRDLLLILSTWLKSQKSGNTTKAYLGLSPSPDAANTSGITILGSEPDAVFVIKTNLSTASVPPALAKRADTSGETYYTTLSSLNDFVMLLWEASVVGGTGYYFSPGLELPGSAFDQQGIITLQLLVIAGSQQAVAHDGRVLLPFNNCALTGTQVDSTSMSLYIQSAGSTDASETVDVALLPPGNTGFGLTIANPATQQDTYLPDELQLKYLYSLLNFSVNGATFEAADSGMPVLPAPSDGSLLQPWEKHRQFRKSGKMKNAAVTPLPYWKYQQVIPISRFTASGITTACPAVAGLPAGTDDPYTGYGTQTVLPYAHFSFAFGDVLGNRSSYNAAVDIPVGYTDNLIGISDWPAVSRSFSVEQKDQVALLAALIASRPSELLPGPGEKADSRADQLLQQQQRYASIYYQLAQPGLQVRLISSLNYIADPDFGNKGVLIPDFSPLWRFAAGFYTFVTTLRAFTPALPQGTQTLEEIVSNYGVSYSELALANQDTDILQLFGNQLPQVPAYYPFVQHLSITSLLALLPAGWPSVTAYEVLTMQENTVLPLKPGTTLTIPETAISTGTLLPTSSLEYFAENNHITAVLLASQNETQTILQPEFVFTIPVSDTATAEVIVDAQTNTFQLVVAAFAVKGVQTSVAELANLQKDAEGMLAPGKTLINNKYVVAAGNTLVQNDSGASPAFLAANNSETKDLFDPGALVFLGSFGNVVNGTGTPTLQTFADRYSCPVALLLSYNAQKILGANGFTLPGTLAWPSQPLQIPYTIQAPDTLQTIASRFSSSSALQLATNNEAMPGTLIPDTDLQISIDNSSYSVNTGIGYPSFHSLLITLQIQAPAATLEDIVSSIGALAGVLNPGGLLICPPALLQNSTLSSIPLQYGIGAVPFSLANAAMQNLIAANVTIRTPDGNGELTTRPNETFNSLVTLFAENNMNLSISDIVNANLDTALLNQATIALLPPADIRFTTALPQQVSYQSAITPLNVALRITRPQALIHPEFRTASGIGPVETTISDFPPPAKDSPGAGDLNFDGLIDAMKQALPWIRLGTAHVDTVAEDLWQVNFNTDGIREVTLRGGTTVNRSAQPRFFALRPLYPQLVSRTVEVPSLNEDGTLGIAVSRSFQAIDVEPWAKRFVADMDIFLSGPYTQTVYMNNNIRDALQTVLQAKADLIPLIAEGLDTILDIADNDRENALADAVEALQQQLGVSLSGAYGPVIIVQYDANVQSDSSLAPASLYGNGTIDVAGFNMIAAKTSLATASSFVNFIGSVENPKLHKSITGNFGYGISNLEFNISDIGLPTGFQSSDWLSFLPVLAGSEKPAALHNTDPGLVQIPVPLREFPGLPAINGQEANQHFPDNTKIPPKTTQLALWDYSLVYSHEHSAQDYVVIKTMFNLRSPELRSRGVVPDEDLFSALADYIQVADPLWQILQELSTPDKITNLSRVENAAHSFAMLCTNISQLWNIRLLQSAFISAQKQLMTGNQYCNFNASVGYYDNGDLYTYTLTYINASESLQGHWPDVYTQLANGTFLQLDVKERDETTTIYKVPPENNVPGIQWPVFKLVWPALNTAFIQNARSGMYVQRNNNLIKDVQTNPAFLFKTEEIVSPDIVTPLNNFGQRISINDLGADLTSALNQAFTNLFGSNKEEQHITIELGYGYELVAVSATSSGILTYLPVGLYPNIPITATTASTISNALQAWKTNNNPDENGGEWIFSLKQYSLLTDQQQTLLNINNLTYKI